MRRAIRSASGFALAALLHLMVLPFTLVRVLLQASGAYFGRIDSVLITLAIALGLLLSHLKAIGF